MRPKKNKGCGSKPNAQATNYNSSGRQQKTERSQDTSKEEKLREAQGESKPTPQNLNDSKEQEKVHLVDAEYRKYSKRKVVSNWDRYEDLDPENEGHEVNNESSRQSFQELVSKAGACVSRFQFKNEREWNNEEFDAAKLVLDLEKLGKDLHHSQVSLADRLYLNSGDKESFKYELNTECTRKNQSIINEDEGSQKSTDMFAWDYKDLNVFPDLRPITDMKVYEPKAHDVSAAQGHTPDQSKSPDFGLEELDALLALSPEQENSAKDSSSLDMVTTTEGADNNDTSATGETFINSEQLKSVDVRTELVVTGPKKEDTTPDLEDWLDEILG